MMLFRIEIECESEAELEVAIADGRWKPKVVETREDQSTHVQAVTVTDPDTHLPVEVEIRKLASGAMVGFDGAYLAQLEEGENPIHPYLPGCTVVVPSDEVSPSASAGARKSTFDDLDKIIGPSGGSAEAIVFMGCGGSLTEWMQGITKAMGEIVAPIKEWYKITTTGGRTDLVMLLPDKGVDLGKLAAWKVSFDDCSWWSDYRVNYRKQH
jgi:hypothetical protein